MTASIDLNTAKMYWIHANYGNNTKQIPEDILEQIETQYATEIKKWKAEVESQDFTEYNFNWDEDFSAGVLDAEDTLGQEGVSGGQIANTGVNLLGVGANVVSTIFVKGKKIFATGTRAHNVATNMSNKAIASIGEENAGNYLVEQAASDKAYDQWTKGSWRITAPLSLGIALLSGVACDKNSSIRDKLVSLQGIMDGEGAAAIQEAMDRLAVLDAEVLTAAEAAEAARQRFTEAIGTEEEHIRQKELEKAELELEIKEVEREKASYETLIAVANKTSAEIQARIDAGETVSESDLYELNTLIPQQLKEYETAISSLNTEIGNLQGKISAVNAEINAYYANLQAEQNNANNTIQEKDAAVADANATYNEQLSNIAVQKGVTEEAASQDVAAQIMCIVEAVSQASNAGLGLTASIQAGTAAAKAMAIPGIGLAVVGYAVACSVMGGVATALSGAAAVFNSIFANDIGKAIDSRKELQGAISTAEKAYQGSTVNYETYLGVSADANSDVNSYVIPDYEGSSSTPSSGSSSGSTNTGGSTPNTGGADDKENEENE